jgi:hypothetical protein
MDERMKIWAAPLLCAMVGMGGTAASAQTAGPMRVTQEIETSRVEATAAVLTADFLRDRGYQNEFPHFGWSLSLGANLGPWFAIVGEADGYAANYDVPDTRPGYGARAAVDHVHDLLAGPRVHSRFLHVVWGGEASDFRIFGQVLAGFRVSAAAAGGRAIQPGAGVDFQTKRGLVIRTEIDRCFVSGSGRGLSGRRFVLGLVFGPS